MDRIQTVCAGSNASLERHISFSNPLCVQYLLVLWRFNIDDELDPPEINEPRSKLVTPNCG